uniref:Uncharacterized protein n=1 Tax=Parascaris univalens TaxID=6257 RepID=A0A915AAS0_PARUN
MGVSVIGGVKDVLGVQELRLWGHCSAVLAEGYWRRGTCVSEGHGSSADVTPQFHGAELVRVFLACEMVLIERRCNRAART